MLKIIENIFPVLMIVEGYMAAIVLACFHRWGSAIFWMAAATCNAAVVFLIKRFG